MSIIITGAASGIGLACAEVLARRPVGEGPARLLLADFDGDRLEQAASRVAQLGAEVETCVADLTDPGAAARVVDTATTRFGGIRVLVSNAGTIHKIPLAELTADQFDRVVSINTRATLLLAQAAHPHLAKEGGAVIATASVAAENPAIGLGAYSLSKAALVMLVRQMAGEWGKDGITCNCVSPGPTHTAMTAASYDNPEIRAARGAGIPMGRVGVPEDLANAVRFLAGPEARHVSGVNLRVDGGLDAVVAVSASGAAGRIGPGTS